MMKLFHQLRRKDGKFAPMPSDVQDPSSPVKLCGDGAYFPRDGSTMELQYSRTFMDEEEGEEAKSTDEEIVSTPINEASTPSLDKLLPEESNQGNAADEVIALAPTLPIKRADVPPPDEPTVELEASKTFQDEVADQGTPDDVEVASSPTGELTIYTDQGRGIQRRRHFAALGARSAAWRAFVRKSRKKIPTSLQGWTKRERVLLTIAVLNFLLVLILFCTNMSMLKHQRTSISNSSEQNHVPRDCAGGGQGQNPTTAVNTIAPTAAPIVLSTNNTTPTNDTIGGTPVITTPTLTGAPVMAPVTGTTSTPSSGNVTFRQQGGGVGDPNSLCGCASCTQAVWNQPAGGGTCGSLIDALVSSDPLKYPTQIHACREIAFEIPCPCGGCDPARCSLPMPEFVLPSGWVPDVGTSATPAPSPATVFTNPSVLQENQLLYCYPDPSVRTTSTLWNGMVIQVKDSGTGGATCGPGNNMFTKNNVRVDEGNQTLTLLYQNGAASEVRVLLPAAQRPFTYGTYRFSIRSVAVKDVTGSVLSNVLPQELVLGMFSWDDTENYAVHENYNHEVDIEVSRWNCTDNADLQFLVQPPGYPQMHRLFTGRPNASSIEDKYQQGGQVHEFTWNPAKINWDSTAGNYNNNNVFVLKTEEALYRKVPDYVQCLPDTGKNLEIRINLWNMASASQPVGLSLTDTVEVVIDNFSFTPSSETYVPVGGYCSKNCQCQVGVSKCVGNICTLG